MFNTVRYTIFSTIIAIIMLAIGVFLLRGILPDEFNHTASVLQTLSNVEVAPQILTTTVLFSQTTQAEESTYLNLTFHLATSRQQYVLGEVIEFTVDLLNQTGDSIPGHSNLRPEYGFLQLHIADRKNSVKDYKAGYWGIAESLFVQEILPPGTHISETATIYFNRSTPRTPDQYLAFSEPGTYFLQAALRNIDTRDLLLSNVVQIELLQPTGQNAIVWKQLRQYDNAIDYQRNYDGGFKFNGLLPVVARFPNSIYAQNIMEKFAEIEPIPTKQESQVQSATANQTGQKIVMVADQQFIVEILPSVSVEDEAALLNELIQLVEQWTSAWNNRDLQAYAESYSHSTYTRQYWEAGSNTIHYNELRERVENLFVKNGKMTVEFFDFTIGTDEVTANVAGSFEQSNQYTFDTIGFVKDDDGVWRLTSPGW